MNTPTPRTDAATYPADCLGTTLVTNRDFPRALETELVTLTGTYTCTHHNDAERTACPVCLVATLTAERDELRDDRKNEIAWAKWASRHLVDAIAVKAERDQLRAEAERFQRLQSFINTAAAEMKAGLITFGGIAELRAERDELRAANIAFRAEQKACEACDEPTAFEVRQLRAEMERTDAIYQRACEVEQELRAELAEMHKSFARNVHMENRVLQTELATEREKSERYRLATLKLDAALAADRARLDAGTILLTVAGERVWHCGVDLRAAIDAGMKEGAK